MATAMQPALGAAQDIDERSMMRRVLMTSVIGTAIEWYDFFLYATASALVFNKLFFPTFDPLVGTILPSPRSPSATSRGRSARSSSAISATGSAASDAGRHPAHHGAGHLPHRPACPPTTRSGSWAPVLLILMRFIQGIGVGGEWGGAVLMAVEHSPANRRGFFGSWPQWGVRSAFCFRPASSR